MLYHLPRPIELPTWTDMMEDLGHPSAEELGRAFATHPRTVQRWHAAGAAPLPVALAVFWCTRWGISRIDARAENAARLADDRRAAAEAQVRALRVELARVLAVADFGSANAPTLSQEAVRRPTAA